MFDYHAWKNRHDRLVDKYHYARKVDVENDGQIRLFPMF